MDKKEKILINTNKNEGKKLDNSLIYSINSKNGNTINLFKDHNGKSLNKNLNEKNNKNIQTSYYESDFDYNVNENNISFSENNFDHLKTNNDFTSIKSDLSNKKNEHKKKYTDLNTNEIDFLCKKKKNNFLSILNLNLYNNIKKSLIFIILIIFYNYFMKSTAEPKNLIKTNICTIFQSKVVDISRLYRFGFLKKKTTHIDNILFDNNKCTTLMNLKNAYVKIKFKKTYFIETIGLYHPIQGNPKSAIKKFILYLELDNNIQKIEYVYNKTYGYQEYKVNKYIDSFMIKIINNYGEKYISIYRIYAFGY